MRNLAKSLLARANFWSMPPHVNRMSNVEVAKRNAEIADAICKTLNTDGGRQMLVHLADKTNYFQPHELEPGERADLYRLGEFNGERRAFWYILALANLKPEDFAGLEEAARQERQFTSSDAFDDDDSGSRFKH